MNEHIKELVRKCGGYHIDDDGEVGNVALLVGTDVEEFAKLLIKECIDVVSKKCASNTAYVALVEHFGVE